MENKDYKHCREQRVTFLPQAFLSYAIGGVFHIHFFQVIGDLAGSLAGVAVGILTCVNLGISPVFAVIVGLVLHDFKLLPAFIAAYIISFGIKFIEKKYLRFRLNCSYFNCSSRCIWLSNSH